MIVKFVGNESTSIELQQGLIALSNFARGLRGGNTPFVLELTKDDTGTKLTVQTFRNEANGMTEANETSAKAEEAIQPVRRGRKMKTAGSVPALGAEEEVIQNEQETTAGSP